MKFPVNCDKTVATRNNLQGGLGPFQKTLWERTHDVCVRIDPRFTHVSALKLLVIPKM